MTKHRRPKLVIHAAPASTQAPAAASPSPAAGKTGGAKLFDGMIQLAAAAVFVVGAITLASPWLRRAEPSLTPRSGWTCYRIERETSTDRSRSSYCSLQDGWHAERWPDGSTVAVPDWAPILRRHYSRDRL
jgi:hypothetical protein